MKKQPIFEGAATALITPMTGGCIDYTALPVIIEKQIAGGISALVIGGTTGEAATLAEEERAELYSFVKERVRGRVKLIFGTGTNDTSVALRHSKMAERIGCDGILVVTPYYNKGTYSGVTEHYKRIAGECSIPLMLYNVPSRTGVNLTLSQCEELAKLDTVCGIKEASDSQDRLVELSRFKDELPLYAGNDSQIYSVLALGGRGVISVASNLYPMLISKLCSCFYDDELQASLKIQHAILDFCRVMFAETNPSPIKYAMSLAGLCKEELRLPLLPPEERVKLTIEQEKKRLDKLSCML